MEKNNITDLNGYRENMTSDMTDIYNIDQDMLNAYLEAADMETPDMWSQIEAGFEAQVEDIKKEKKRKLLITTKTIGFVAAGLLIILIAVPVLLLGLGGSKGEKSMDTTEAVKSDALEESADMVYDGAIADEEIAQEATGEEPDAKENVNEAADMVATDKRQLRLQGELIFDDETDGFICRITDISLNEYNEFNITIGDEIVITNNNIIAEQNAWVQYWDITFDSISLNDIGQYEGRVVDFKIK